MTTEQAHAVQRPSFKEELSSICAAQASDGTFMVAASKLQVPPQFPSGNVVHLDLASLDKVTEHCIADQVIAVETGIKVSQLNSLLAESNQFAPLRVPASWSLLDVINFAESGTLEHGYGSVSSLVLGCDAYLADGTAIKCGGRVVKNVTGYDVTKLIVGSHCWLAVPASVHLRLYALPQSSFTLIWSFGSLWQLMNAAMTLIKSGLPFAALEAVVSNVTPNCANKFALLGQILTLPAVASEIADSAGKLLGKPEIELEAGQSDKLWQDLADEMLAGEAGRFVKVVAPPLELASVIESLPAGSLWQARPARGKITALCSSAELAVEQLDKMEPARKEQLTVATADTRYNYRVRRFSKDDSAQLKLNQAIKQALDPKGLLNPFVQL